LELGIKKVSELVISIDVIFIQTLKIECIIRKGMHSSMGSCCVEFVNNTITFNLFWALIAPNSPIIYLCP
jgi:hypothetical protein